MISYVHLNGRLVAAARAKVSVFDRGLQFGDGLFETLRAYAGQPFALPEHLDRMRRGAAALQIGFPERPWARQIEALLRKNHLLRSDARVRITVTRGVAPPTPVPPPALTPTVIISAVPVDAEIDRAQRRGVSVVLLPFERGGSLAGHKALNYLPAVLGKMEAQRRGAFEALFVGPARRLSEGTTSNIFIRLGGRLYTPPAKGILVGVTRQFVIRLARMHGVSVAERKLTVADLREADEAFLTGSVVEIVPVVAVDGHPLGRRRPGAVTRQLQRSYRELTRAGDAGCRRRRGAGAGAPKLPS